MWSVSLEYLLVNHSVFGDLYVNIKCQRWVIINLQNVNKQVFFESRWGEGKYGWGVTSCLCFLHVWWVVIIAALLGLWPSGFPQDNNGPNRCQISLNSGEVISSISQTQHWNIFSCLFASALPAHVAAVNISIMKILHSCPTSGNYN